MRVALSSYLIKTNDHGYDSVHVSFDESYFISHSKSRDENDLAQGKEVTTSNAR